MAVKGGDEVVPKLNNVIDAFDRIGLPVFFTRDWHPSDHISFKSQGGRWPPHCIQGTPGAEFYPGLKIPPSSSVISKGNKQSVEAYSGFQGTDLGQRLKASGVDEVLIGGLTTDYCVKETALDALHAGFKVGVIEDGVRAVDLAFGDGAMALGELRKAGVKMTTSSALVGGLHPKQHGR